MIPVDAIILIGIFLGIGFMGGIGAVRSRTLQASFRPSDLDPRRSPPRPASGSGAKALRKSATSPCSTLMPCFPGSGP